MATLYTKKRYVPKFWRNKRIYQVDSVVRVQTIQGSGAATPGVNYQAGDGLLLDVTEFNVVPDDSTVEINGSSQVAVKDGGINTDQLATGAVTTGKIADNAVTSAKIQAGAVSLTDVDGSLLSGRAAENLSQQDPGASSTWEYATVVSAASENFGAGDKIRIEIGYVCAGADCYAGIVVRHAATGTQDFIIGTTVGDAPYETDLLNNTGDLTILVCEIWILTTTKVAVAARYLESGTDGSQNIESDIVTFTNTTIGTSGNTFQVFPYMKDENGNDNITKEFCVILAVRESN